MITEGLKDKGGVRKAVDWSTEKKLSDGLHLVWKDPQTYNAGYAWWVRQIGSLVPDRRGQSSLWNVTGHKTSERRHDGYNGYNERCKKENEDKKARTDVSE